MKLFAWLFGCPHEKRGFPITRNGVTYRACLECGDERKYDWRRMRYVEFEQGEKRKVRAPNYHGMIS